MATLVEEAKVVEKVERYYFGLQSYRGCLIRIGVFDQFAVIRHLSKLIECSFSSAWFTDLGEKDFNQALDREIDLIEAGTYDFVLKEASK